ncbi:unnamed protein product [Polarella glacialis]|uniref:Uncharacterized protein n=1 Tax=Polarella glacialis TaxID=89957 RepID=A0A813F9L6_POLGL|nr:unnamed protein product [Polarella glacialis]
MSTCKGSGGPLNSTNLLPVRSYAGPDTATRLLSACVGSAAVALTVTPLDVAKVRMQAAAPVHDIKSCMSLASLEHCRLFYCCNGITEHCFDKRDVRWSHCFRHQLAGASPQPAVGVGGNRLGTIGTLRNIFSEGGVAGLYAGLPVTMLIAVPANVIYFASYEMLRDWLQAEQRVPACCAPVIAGGAARAAAVTACAPLEVVRTRIQAGRLADGAMRQLPLSARLPGMESPTPTFDPDEDDEEEGYVPPTRDAVASAAAERPPLASEVFPQREKRRQGGAEAPEEELPPWKRRQKRREQ